MTEDLCQQTLFDVGHLSAMADTPLQNSVEPYTVEGSLINDLPHNLDILTIYSLCNKENSAQPMADMADMADKCPTQPLTIRPEDRGPIPHYMWLAWCQQCELKKPFTDHTQLDTWVANHRRKTDHRVQTGAGKL